MFQDCKKLFMVPSFPIILLAEGIAAVGASGTGYQILYIEVSPFIDTLRQSPLRQICLQIIVSLLCVIPRTSLMPVSVNLMTGTSKSCACGMFEHWKWVDDR